MSKKKKKSGKNEDVKLVVRIEAELRDAFIEKCQEIDTTASREVRQFIRDFLARSGKTDALDPESNTQNPQEPQPAILHNPPKQRGEYP